MLKGLASGTTDRGVAAVGSLASSAGNFYYAVRYGEQPSQVVTVAVPQVCADWIDMERAGEQSLLKEGAQLACRNQLAEMTVQGALITETGEAS